MFLRVILRSLINATTLIIKVMIVMIFDEGIMTRVLSPTVYEYIHISSDYL